MPFMTEDQSIYHVRKCFPLTDDEFEGVRKAYEDDLIPIKEIASWFHVSRTAIYKFLKKHGIDTSKRKFPVKCHWCEKEFDRTKGRLRSQKYHFCSVECYYNYIHEIGINYKPNRHGQRIGRMKVSEHFELEPGMVVHHEDGNNMNNEIDNLKVFANNGDHVRYHRWVNKAEPIWDGGSIG